MEPYSIHQHVYVIALKTAENDIVGNSPFADGTHPINLFQCFADIFCRTFTDLSDSKGLFFWRFFLPADGYLFK